MLTYIKNPKSIRIVKKSELIKDLLRKCVVTKTKHIYHMFMHCGSLCMPPSLPNASFPVANSIQLCLCRS